MKINNEVKVGLMVVAAIVLLVGLTVKTKKLNFSKKTYTVKASFKSINGVNLNSPVMFNGYEVGVVKKINIYDDQDETRMELTLVIDEKARLREGAKAYIKNLGLMGEKFVGLTSGKRRAPYLPSGAVISGEEPPDFEELVKEGKEIARNLREISENVNERLQKNKERVDEILESINITLKNVASIANNVDERLEVNKKNIDMIVSNLTATSKNLEEMSHDLKLNPWKIMYRSRAQKKLGRKHKSLSLE